MALETKLLIIGLLAIGGTLAYSVCAVLTAWTRHHLSRHDLIVASKAKRLAYLKMLADRDKAQLEAAGFFEEDAKGIAEDAGPQLAQALGGQAKAA